MRLSEEQKSQLETEIKFSASRSSGPGGQNVNKVNTRVELRFSIPETSVFSRRSENNTSAKTKKQDKFRRRIITHIRERT